MKIAVAADERAGVAEAVVDALRSRGHEVVAHGALVEGEPGDVENIRHVDQIN
jgi:ribose 5-phosphate isomerase B